MILPSADALRQYSHAALANAAELAEEAALLATHSHFARAYFLAVACIEETGKAVLLFEACGRNLKDPAVFSRLIRAWSDHGEKITSAFVPWFFTDAATVRTIALPLADLMTALQNGREPAMYSDIRSDNHQPQLPSQVVREVAARNCIELAEKCLAFARHHLETRTPTQYTREQDQLFSLPRTQYHRIMSNPDFWWFYLEEVEAGRADLSKAIVEYRQRYESLGKKFQASGA